MSYKLHFGMASLDLAGGDKQKAPKRILLIRDGDPQIKGHDGLKLDAQAAQEIIDNYHEDGNELMIDFNHAVTKPANDLNRMIAAGWCRNPGGLEYVKGEGLYANVDWNAEAAQLIEDKKFKYVSPLFRYDEDTGAIVRVVNFALTNIPKTRKQTELLAASEDLAAMLERVTMSKKTNKKKDKGTKLRTAKAEDEIPGVTLDVESLPEEQVAEVDAVGDAITALADMAREKGAEIPEDADALTILAAVGDMLAGKKESADGDSAPSQAAETLASVAAAMDMEGVTDGKTLVAAASKLVVKEGSLADVQERLKTIEDDKKTSTVAAMIEAQIEAGVFSPDDDKMIAAAERIAENDPEGFEEFCSGLAPLIQPGQKFKPDAEVKKTNGARKTAIVAASQEYGEQGCAERGVTVRYYIDQHLREAGHALLTVTETKELESN